MKVLVISDDFWHPGEVIARGMRPLEAMGYELDHVMEPKDILTKDMIYDYDVIVNAKTDCLSPANPKALWFEEGLADVMPEDFKEYIASGHGFIALHSGNTYHKEKTPGMVDIIGNEFVGHPKQCPITMKAVGNHPIMNGVNEFTIKDEHYMVNIVVDDADVFMQGTSDSTAGTQNAGYTRTIGKGRVVVLTPGHNVRSLANPEFTKVLKNAIDWAAGKI